MDASLIDSQPSRLCLRAASADDVEAIATVWHRAWRDGHLGHVPEALHRHRRRTDFRERVPQRIPTTTVATLQSRIVGFVTVREDELEQIFVDEAARGTGAAAALLRDGERRIAGRFDQAWLAVASGNARARRFYEREGWRDAGSFDYAAETTSGTFPVPCHRYEKRVKDEAREGATPAAPVVRRCWAGEGASPLMLDYHDREWGVPLHGDRELFAKLILDGFQAGLSWSVILNKRARFLEVFDGFDPERIARYDRRRIGQILKDPGIVRNRQKVEAAVSNAKAFLLFREKEGSFDRFLWSFVGGTPKQNARRSLRQLPARTRESDRMSEALVGRGFRFVGPTICYAFMQAVGMVNDHLVTCFRHAQLNR